MKNFLSTIYIETNSATTEKISIGLIVVTEHKVFFKYSKNKLKIAEKLLGNSIENLVKFSLNAIKEKVTITNAELAKQSQKLFSPVSFFTDEYIKYLNRYSQGLLQYDAPKPYVAEVNPSVFESLFATFISKEESSKDRNTFYHQIKNKIKKSAMMERVNLDYKLSPVKIPSLIAQENITIISKNGNILAGELIDFTANIEMVKQNIYEFEAIVKSLKIFEKQHIINSKNNTNYYALFNKPEPKSVQEKFLNHLKSLDQTDFINFQLEEASYIETLEQKILKEEYQKFSVFEESLGL